MQKTKESEEFSEAETEKRMADAIRNALSTPHKPHKKPSKKRGAAKKKRSARTH